MWLGISLLSAFAALMLLIVYALWVEPNWLRIRRRILYLESWDPTLNGFTILHLSDLHIGHATKRLARFLERANRISADLVVITGDFIAGSKFLGQCEQVLQELTNHREVFGVLGNHEHRDYRLTILGQVRVRRHLDAGEIRDVLERSGVRVLINNRVAIPYGAATLTLAGIDDLFSRAADLEGALQGVKAVSSLLLSHSPDVLGDASKLGIPLVLSGHTHGGQVRFPWLGTPTTGTLVALERPYGINRREGTIMHVSPGLGTSLVPFRFFARPEATLLELRAVIGKSSA